MKLSKMIGGLLSIVLLLTACNAAPNVPSADNVVQIVLSDNEITVDGKPVSADSAAAVYTANDIVYYEAGKDFIYGEGTEKDAHTAEEAAAHTVVHITKPGTYSLSGKLSLGQIAVDLGDGAKKDPAAVVTLILNGVDITCQVAPAVIFYNVYECGNDDTTTATKDVDTSAAGANVIIADGTANAVNGAYVARIYEPKSVVLNGDNTKVAEADKLHKYDGAFYSKRSMNISGGKDGSGVLKINAENEGLDSEMHLTINGGNIEILSGNDGINTNEDNISVTTINGGTLRIKVNGNTGEGDGIDSNGWLVINGGSVVAAACANSADAGIDSDRGIHINGGTVIATGNMLDRIESSGQNYAVFNFAQKQTGKETVVLKDGNGNTVLEASPENAYSTLIYSSSELIEGTYTLWSDDQQLAGSAGNMMGGHGKWPGGTKPGKRQDGTKVPEGDAPAEGFPLPEGDAPAEGFPWPEGEKRPGSFTRPESTTLPNSVTRPEGNNWPENSNKEDQNTSAISPEFKINNGGNTFTGVQLLNK